jgi:hypothetical protein
LGVLHPQTHAGYFKTENDFGLLSKEKAQRCLWACFV